MASAAHADVAEQLDLGAEWQAIDDMRTSEVCRTLVERGLADALDGLVGRSRRGDAAGVRLGVRVLHRERDYKALLRLEATVAQERLADARAAERHHGGLVVHLVRGGPEEGREHPRAR